MQPNQIPTIENKIIDDNSSWASLSDPETPNLDPKPAPKPQTPLPQPVIETDAQRLQRFNLADSDLATLYCVGSLEALTHNDIIIQPNNELLNIDNLLIIKLGERSVVLGNIDDVFGSIESPLYSVKMDDYLRQLRPCFEAGSVSDVKVYVNKQKAAFLDQEEILSMRMERGTDACFDTQRAYDSSDDESEYMFNQSQQNEYFSKRNKSPYEQRDFEKRVKQRPFMADEIYDREQGGVHRRRDDGPTPGNMLLNYLQHGRQQHQGFNMNNGHTGFQEFNHMYGQYNGINNMRPVDQQQWIQNPHQLQNPHDPRNPQNPHIYHNHPNQNNQTNQQNPQTYPQPMNNNNFNSFFYQ